MKRKPVEERRRRSRGFSTRVGEGCEDVRTFKDFEVFVRRECRKWIQS